jgi:hypothetical protein
VGESPQRAQHTYSEAEWKIGFGRKVAWEESGTNYFPSLSTKFPKAPTSPINPKSEVAAPFKEKIFFITPLPSLQLTTPPFS